MSLEGPCQAEGRGLGIRLYRPDWKAWLSGQGHPSPRRYRGAAALGGSSGQVRALPAEGCLEVLSLGRPCQPSPYF